MLNLSLAQCLQATRATTFKVANLGLKTALTSEDLAFLGEYLRMTPLNTIDLSLVITEENSQALYKFAEIIAGKKDLEQLNFIVERVDFDFQYRNDPDLKILGFIDNYYLKKVNNKINEAMVQMFTNKPYLQKLKVDLLKLENPLSKSQAYRFARNMQHAPLVSLDLGCAVEEESQLPLFNPDEINTKLIFFKLRGCRAGRDVLQYLQKTRKLRDLVINTMDFEPEDLQYLYTILKGNPRLIFFTLSGSNLGQIDSTLILDTLQDCSSLGILELSESNLSQINIDALCDYLRKNPKNLISLNLNKNAYMPMDAIKLSQTLASNTTIEQLSVDDNYIENEGLQALIQLLKTNRAITKVSMSNNCRFSPSNETVNQLCAFLSDPNCQLKELDFVQNTDVAQLNQLNDAIHENTSLVEVNLNFKNTGILGAMYQELIKEHLERSTSEITPDNTNLKSPTAESENEKKEKERSYSEDSCAFFNSVKRNVTEKLSVLNNASAQEALELR